MARGGAATRASAPWLAAFQAAPNGARQLGDPSQSPTAARPVMTPTTDEAVEACELLVARGSSELPLAATTEGGSDVA